MLTIKFEEMKKKLGRTVKEDLSIKSTQLGICRQLFIHSVIREIFRSWKNYSRRKRRGGDFILFIIGSFRFCGYELF